MVERSVGFAVRKSCDDAVVALVAPCVLMAWRFGVARTIAEGPHYLLLSPQCTVQSLPCHRWSQPKGYEALACEHGIILGCEGVIFENHFGVILLVGRKSSHAYTGARAREA